MYIRLEFDFNVKNIQSNDKTKHPKFKDHVHKLQHYKFLNNTYLILLKHQSRIYIYFYITTQFYMFNNLFPINIQEVNNKILFHIEVYHAPEWLL